MRRKRCAASAPQREGKARELFLVRHAESVGMREGRFVGRDDPPLTPGGRRQAERIAQRMARLTIGQVISSPQRRALATALRIARVHGLPVAVRPELAELDFGQWEGRPWRTLDPGERQRHQAWLADPWNVAPPGGESLRSLWSRVGRVWRDLRSSPIEKATVVVGHGGSLRVLLCMALKCPRHMVTRFVISPGAVSCLGWASARAWLSVLNDGAGSF